MLLKITEKCNMGCIHCSDECGPTGKEMSIETLMNCIGFIKKFNKVVLLISGGEPTLHSRFKEFMELIGGASCFCVGICSNGDFDGHFAKYLSRLPFDIQIMNDRRYYPKDIQKFTYGNFIYEDTVRNLVNIGRAKTNKLKCVSRNPGCFNLRSAIKNGMNLDQAMFFRSINGAFCKPMIDIYGNIYLGEHQKQCLKIGHVIDPISKIESNILKMKCNNCGDFNNLNKEMRLFVNEL